MRKFVIWILPVVLLCMGLAGCDSEKYWIRKNEPVPQPVIVETTAPESTQIPLLEGFPTSLAMDGSVTEEMPLCFSAGLDDLANDLGYYWKRYLPEDDWIVQEQTQAPYSRITTQYLRLDMDHNLKNEPTVCAYLSEQGKLCEMATILLTHDWTPASEDVFLLCAQTLLQCVWPDCGDGIAADTAQKLQTELNENNCAGETVYVHGTAAAYSYIHSTGLGIHVIPMNEERLRDLEKDGVEIIKIP